MANYVAAAEQALRQVIGILYFIPVPKDVMINIIASE